MEKSTKYIAVFYVEIVLRREEIIQTQVSNFGRNGNGQR